MEVNYFMNSKITTRYLPLILVIALVLTFGLVMAYAAPVAATTQAEPALLSGEIPIMVDGREGIKTELTYGEASAYNYLNDLTYEYGAYYKDFAETKGDYAGSITAVLYDAYIMYYEDEEETIPVWGVDYSTRHLGFTDGYDQKSWGNMYDAPSWNPSYPAAANDDFNYVLDANKYYIVNLTWTANGDYEEGDVDILVHVGKKTIAIEFSYATYDAVTMTGDYYTWAEEAWAGPSWLTYPSEIVQESDDIKAAWYYMDGSDKVYLTKNTDAGTYENVRVELTGADAGKYEFDAKYYDDVDTMDYVDFLPSITINKNESTEVVAWMFNGAALSVGGSIPYTGHAPAITAVTNVGAEVTLTWAAGSGPALAAMTDEEGNYCIMDENSAYLTDGVAIDSLDNYSGSVFYWAIANLDETANYNGLSTKDYSAFFCFTTERRSVAVTWINETTTMLDSKIVELLDYNGGAQYPMYRIDLEGVLSGETEIPAVNGASDDLNAELGEITALDSYWTYSLYLEDTVNYKFEGYSPDEPAIRYYRINKGPVTVTITQKEDSHFYYRKAVEYDGWTDAYFDNFDVTIEANGAEGIFKIDPTSWYFLDAKGYDHNYMSYLSDDYNHPGAYDVYVSTICYILATGPYDSMMDYYVYNESTGTFRDAKVGEDFISDDPMDGQNIYVVSMDGDSHYFNKHNVKGNFTIEKAPVYVRTTDSFTFDEDENFSPDEESYKFYLYEAGVAGNLWDAKFAEWYVEITGSYYAYEGDDKTFYEFNGYEYTPFTPVDGENVYDRAYPVFYTVKAPFTGSTAAYHDAGTYDLGATIYDGDYCTWADDYVLMINEGETVRDAGAVFTIAPYEVTVDIVEPDWRYSGSEKNVTASYTNTKGVNIPITTFSYAYASGAEGYPDRTNVTGNAFYAVFEITDTNYIAEGSYDYSLVDGGRSVKTANFLVEKNVIALSSSYPASASDYGVATGLYIVQPTVTGFIEGVAPSPTSAKYYWAVANSFEPFPYDPSTNWTDSSVTAFDQYANVGSYWILWVLEYQNYATIITHKTHVINKVALTVVAENQNVTYGDAAPSYTYYLDGFVEGEDADTLHNGTLTGAPTLSCEYAQWNGVGGYTTNVTSVGNLAATNYSFADVKVTAGTLTVGKADYQLPHGVEQKYGADGKIVYTGGDLSANGKINIAYGKLREADVITVLYKLHDAEDIPANWYTSIPTLENAAAGYYDIDYKFVNSNYNDFASTFTITVSPASISGHFQLDPEKSFVYTGSAQTPALLNTLATVDDADITLAFSLDGVDYNLTTFPTFTNVSENRTVYWHGTADNHNMVGGSITVTMTPKEVTVTFTKDAITKTYDSKAFDLDGVGTVEGTVEGESLTTVFGGGNIISAGVYSKSFTLVAGNAQTTRGNYTLVAVGEQYSNVVNGEYDVFNEAGSVNVEIERRHLTYKQQIDGEDATSVTYNGAGKVFTLVVTNAQTSAGAVLDDISLTLATAKNGEGAASVTETNKAAYTYYVKKAGGTAANYYLTNGDDETITFTIAEKTINVTYALENYGEFTYGDTTGFNNLYGINNKANFYGMLTLSEALSGGEAVADVIDLSFKKGGVITEIGATADVGKYVLYAAIKEGVTNYAFNFLVNSDEKAYINITKKALTATWNVAANGELHEDNADHWFEFVYDGTAKQAYADLVGVEDGDDVSIVYGGYSTMTNVWTNGGHHATTIVGIEGDDAGNYSIDLTQAWHVNYFVILPKPITVNWGTTAFTYTGAGQAPTVGITGGSLVAGDAADVSLVEPTKQVNASAVNAHYTATVSLSGNKAANYTITNSTCDFTIAPYAVTPALYIDDELVDGDNGSVTYDGNNHVFVIKATGLNEDVVIFYTSVNDEHINVFNTGTGYNAGYRGHATGVFDNNYAVDEYCYFNWAITARPLSLNWALEANGSFEMLGFGNGTYKTFTFIYNGTVQHPVAELLNVVGDEDVEIVYPAGIKNAITNGGYHAYEIVSFKGNDKNNYAWANDAEKKVFFDMQAKPITVTYTSTAKSATYGATAEWEALGAAMEENNYYLTADLGSGDGIFDVVSVKMINGSSVDVIPDDELAVGTYYLVATDLNNTNYDVTIALGDNAKLTVTKATLTEVSVEQAAVLTYNGALQTAAVNTAATAVNDMDVVFTYSADGKTYGEAGVVPAFKDAGNHTVFYSASAANHESFGGSFTVTIAKKAITLTYNQDAPLVYTYGDASVYNLNPYAYIDGYLTGFAMSDLAVLQANPLAIFQYIPLKINGILAQNLNGQNFGYAATYNLTIDPATVNANYEATVALGDNAKLVIEPKALFIRVDNQIVTYGDEAAAFTVKYEGFVTTVTVGDDEFNYGDSEAKLQGTLAFACDYTTESGVGSYKITANGVSNGNYTVKYVDGVVLVIPRVVTLTWGDAEFTYDKTAKLPTVKLGNLVNDDAVTATVTGEATVAGEHVATVTALSDTNYTLPTKTTEAFTIAKKAITVTADDKESDYAADLVKLTYVGAIEEGDEVVTIATNADKSKTGEYAITLTSTNNPNYDVTLVNGKYTVKAKAEVNASGEVEKTEDIKAEIKEAKAEEGVSIKNMIQNVIEAAADAPVATLEIEVTDAATVAFDKAALKKLAENADVKISYKETKKEVIDQSNEAIKNAEFVIEISLAGASFEGGKATITTDFEDNAPGGKKAVLYYVAEDGTKTEIEATFADGKLTFTTTHFSTYIVEYKLTGGSIAGIVIACVVGVAGIAVGVFFFLKKRKANGGNGGEAAADEAATETPADAE